MKVAIAYVFPNLAHAVYEPAARRFAQTYMEHPPGDTDHEIYVVVNGGGKVTPRQQKLFDPLVPTFIYHNNYGRDIGAYQMAARHIKCDLLVCLGAPIRCRRAGWLDRMVTAYENNGPGLYACWCFHHPAPHARTTAFWLPPQVLNGYPTLIDNNHRYEFEHGSTSITRWCLKNNWPVYQVTWNGVYSIEHWHHVPAEDCFFLDQHYERSGV